MTAAFREARGSQHPLHGGAMCCVLWGFLKPRYLAALLPTRISSALPAPRRLSFFRLTFNEGCCDVVGVYRRKKIPSAKSLWRALFGRRASISREAYAVVHSCSRPDLQDIQGQDFSSPTSPTSTAVFIGDLEGLSSTIFNGSRSAVVYPLPSACNWSILACASGWTFNLGDL